MLVLMLLSVVRGEECRPFLCKSTALGTCATLTNSSVAIQGCPGDLTCSYLSDVLPYLNHSDYTVTCLPDSLRDHPYTFKQLIAGIDNYCDLGVMNSTPRLVDQSTFKVCQQDQDCLLTDGSYTSCVCGLNGTRYCKYGPGDDIYLNFSAAACNKEWNRYLRLGVITVLQGDVFSFPECMSAVFNDFSYYVYLREGGDVYTLFGIPTGAAFIAPFSLVFL